jgi:ElaB/YqjD/DUF883 family membrane-anchored ribosome-binding protein
MEVPMTKREREMAQLKEEIADLTARLKDMAGDATDEGMERASETVANFREQAGEMLSAAKQHLAEARDTAKATARKTDEYVHENPWQVVAGVAALGLLVGALMGRRRD